jgi:hypothetical protein
MHRAVLLGLPEALSQADAGKAWCARGNDHPNGVLFTLQRPEPVHVAEIVYYGRTAFDWNENWTRNRWPMKKPRRDTRIKMFQYQPRCRMLGVGECEFQVGEEDVQEHI